jgi:outer membrane protein assembly factor BamB
VCFQIAPDSFQALPKVISSKSTINILRGTRQMKENALPVLVLLLSFLLLNLSIYGNTALFGFSQSASTDWPMSQKDAQHTGFALGSAPNSSQLKFTVNPYSDFYYGNDTSAELDYAHSPIILGDKVIVSVVIYSGGVYNFSLNALDKASGKLLWASPVGSEAVATPAAYNDRIVVPSRDGYLYCFDADTGDLVWKFQIQWAGWAGMANPPSPIIQDGIIYQAGGSSVYSIYSISLLEMQNETAPKLVWKYDLTLDAWANRTVISSPTYGDGRIFLAYSVITRQNENCTNNLICLSANDGRSLWNNTVANRRSTFMFDCPSPSFSNGYVYGEAYGTVCCFEAVSGKLLWSFGSSGGGTSLAISLGKLYVGKAEERNNTLFCLDASNGNVIWQHGGFMGGGGPIYAVALSSPTVADGKVFICSMMQSHEEFYALNAVNGEFVWNYAAVVSPPAISEGAVYIIEVSANSSYVTAFGVPEYFRLRINSLLGNTTGADFYPVNSTAHISVDSPLSVSEGVRYVFAGWTGDFVSDAKTATLLMNSSKTLSTNWRLQYYLTVDSSYGSPTGEGWHDANSTAVFSVNPTDSFVIQSNFLHWADDSTSSDATSSILMDSPKKVTAVWESNTSSLFFLGIAIGVTLVVLVVAGVVIFKRRKRRLSA